MDQLDAHILNQIAVGEIGRVIFRKDEAAADLLVCDIVMAAGEIWTVNEDFSGWPQVVERLEDLDGWPADWRKRGAQLADGQRWEAWGA